MADPIAAPLSQATLRPTRAPHLGASLAMVIGYWWIATGLTIALQQTNSTRSVALVATSLLAIVGAVFVMKTRNATTVSGARLAFLGASLIWWWGATLFYGGVGIHIPSIAAGPHGSAALAWQAIGATLRADSVMVVALVVLLLAVRSSGNRVALYTLAVYWGTLQTAKLNVFFGVRNSGEEMLPAPLAGLNMFFGPARNSSLLLPTLLVLGAICAFTVIRARNARGAFERHASSMIALLMALAVLEHVALGISARLPLWDVFLTRAS